MSEEGEGQVIGYREAEAGDAEALGALHVACWREAYAGLLPEALLRGLSAGQRAAMWRAVLNDNGSSEGTAVFVAERGGAMIGFASCGGQRDEALAAAGFDGEFGAIYVRAAAHRTGIGRTLMALMARNLLERGKGAASLWVLRDNAAARSFYEALGGALAGQRREEASGVTLSEVAYGWTDLLPLAG